MPRIEIRKGQTLILNGPASALLIEGKASILGYPLSSKKRLIVKSWRSRPIYAEEDSMIDYTSGEGGGVEIVDGDTVPAEWRSFAEKVSEKPSKVYVYGGADSGKTSLATLILNYFAGKLGAAVYVDLDLGQSNICPPTTIGFTSVRSPVPDVSYLRMEAGKPIGFTSPMPVFDKHVKAVERLAQMIEDRHPGKAASVDLDGWVSGSAAIEHKKRLLMVMKPDYLASIGGLPAELRSMCDANGVSYVELPPPFKIRKREQEARKRIREIAYNRFLRNSSLRKIPISWVRVELLNGVTDAKAILGYIEKLVGEYVDETGDILESRGEGALEALAKRRLGLLSYVYGVEERFAGIGLLMAFNLRKNFLKIFTPYSGQIKRLTVGALIISVEGEEIYSSFRALAREL